MDKVILKVDSLSKQYRLGLVGTGTINDDLKRWWYKIRGKDDPFLKVGDTNDRTKKGTSDYVWALKDINFDVNQGDVLGIIGKNGAGKSTLLKILSKITSPTTGSIKFNGRIASLLEVGTGFHPELTGNENIYLNGAILGMTKTEINDKYDEIVKFSGCERYINTPVKRYSSGMTVRLAFAVAAFLEPDILIIDEVLAVGDDEFQKKAIGKMKDISGTEGRTVLFVSHNMAAIRSLCDRVVVLEDGKVKYDGSTEKGLEIYLSKNQKLKSFVDFSKEEKSINKKLYFDSINLKNQKNNGTKTFSIGDDIVIQFAIKNKTEENKIDVGVQIKTIDDLPIFHIMGRDSNFVLFLNKNKEYFEIIIKDIRLYPGVYSINLTCSNLSGHQIFDDIENAITFEIIDGGTYTSRHLPKEAGLFFITPEWRKL